MPDIDLLKYYRKLDTPDTGDGVVQPENQTLNSRHIAAFLMGKYNLEARRAKEEDLRNFDDQFNLAAAKELVGSKKSQGEQKMLEILTEAELFLEERNALKIFENMNEAAAMSQLHDLLSKKQELGEFDWLKKAYQTYRLIRVYCKRTIQVGMMGKESRDEQKTDIASESGQKAKDTLGKAVDKLKENFGNMSGTSQLIAVGAILYVTASVLASENEGVNKFKRGIWAFAKLGMGAYAINILTQVATGKTAWEHVAGASKADIAKESFWTNTFRTDKENAEILRKGLVYLHEQDFLDLAERYRRASADNTKKIELASVDKTYMTPEQIYIALDVFFRQYGGTRNPINNAENLSKKYRDCKPRLSWGECVTTELVEDGKIKFEGKTF